MTVAIPDSFDSSTAPVRGPAGQLAHPAAVDHLRRLEPKFYAVGEHAWCLVGNGLSNQTFVEGPRGIIAIDTGESVEEMQEAIDALRRVTDKPVVACIYSHFHYVSGTTALLAETGGRELEIWGHAGIEANLRRLGGEVAPRSSRGMVFQFGVALPADGEDALLSCGLGLFLRNPSHAPFTHGHIPATHTFDRDTRATIAGLDVELYPAPSDATDSITIWFPQLGLCVNNLLWPALFNIFAIRGEEYRDPRIVLGGLRRMEELAPQQLIGTHGPPIEGAGEIRDAIVDYSDAIRFIWDQVVRGANKGMTCDELADSIQLPDRFRRSYVTQQFYGLVEHHVRQVYAGLFGWFDENEGNLFPLPAPERARRLVEGFGGREAVRAQVDAALAEDDWRWALEMAGWLVRGDAPVAEDRQRAARALRGIAVHTTSANVRNWCLTKALELEGAIDLSRFYTHRFRAAEVLAAPAASSIDSLRVLLDPASAEGLDETVGFEFNDGTRGGLHVRGCVAIPVDGQGADVTLGISHELWAALLAGKATLSAYIDQGKVTVTGDPARLRRVLGAFDHKGLAG